MATTIKEFKEWLNQFPEETEIEVAVQQPASNWEGYGPLSFVSPELINNIAGTGWEFLDFRNNQFVKPDNVNYGRCFLRLGEPC